MSNQDTYTNLTDAQIRDMIAKEKIFEVEAEFIPEDEDEPHSCTFFMCGKKLSLVETLCGTRCINHQGTPGDIMNCLSV